jgi:threonine/homoserine/homoserine lactone efflux protein
VDLLPFLAISVVVAVLPGVDMAVVTQQVLARGRLAGLLAVAGIVTGSAVQATAAAVGLSALLAASAPAFAALKITGAVYLGWLGARTLWRARRGAPREADATAPPGGRSFHAGLLTNLLNPKIIAFYVAFLPQFVVPGPGAAGRTALLAAIFLTLATAWLLLFTALLDRLRPLLTRAAVRRRMEQVTGVVLVGLGVRLAAEA